MINLLEDMQHVEVRQNLAVWQGGRFDYNSVEYIEPLPLSSQSIVDYGAAAANGTIAAVELTIFNVQGDNELIQVRPFPIDDIEIIVWLQRSQGKFATRGMQARVSKLTRAIDPYLRSAEFNLKGTNNNPFVEVRNPGDYAYAQARVWFAAKRYILRPLKNVVEQEDLTGVVRPYVKNAKGELTLLPMKYVDAEARST